jgi:V8-like Glu-specific endopeptidase
MILARPTRPLLPLAVLSALAALATLLGPSPAGAVVDGEPDGARHPYAGAVDGRPLGGPVRFGSGVLISPTVFLTVGHGTAHFDAAGVSRARVTFDPVVTASSTWHEGTVHTNPAYDPNGSGTRGDFGDLGVIVFDEPVLDVTPARLPTAGYLDGQAGRLAGLRLEIPGYGVAGYAGGSGHQGGLDYASAGTRRIATEAFASLSPGFLRLRATSGADICTGDSGAPSVVAGSDLVLGLTAVELSLDGSQCVSGPWEQRVDTPGARAFLAQYVSLP